MSSHSVVKFDAMENRPLHIADEETLAESFYNFNSGFFIFTDYI